jgi:hypothetical protein
MAQEQPTNLDAAFPEPEVQEPAAQETVQEDSLGNQFLSKIPEQDREIVAKYVKDWDGNVTKKFQSIHEEYKPYKELGASPEDLRKAWTAIQNLNNAPEASFKAMYKALRDRHGEAFDQVLEALYEEDEDEMSEDYEYEEGEEEAEEEYDDNSVFQANVEKELQELRDWKQQQEQAIVAAEENAQLDRLMSDLHTKHGDFDDVWVLTQMSAGATPDQAMNAWNTFVSKLRNSQNTPTPPRILGGQGGVPTDQVDVAKLDAKGRKALIAQYLGQ